MTFLMLNRYRFYKCRKKVLAFILQFNRIVIGGTLKLNVIVFAWLICMNKIFRFMKSK